MTNFCSITVVLAAGSTSVEVPAQAQGLTLAVTEAWSVSFDDGGSPVALSSPNVATLAGEKAVVVGDLAGHIYALSLADGSAVQGWPASTGGIPVQSTPSVAALSPGSPDDTVFVGVGSAAKPHSGGYEAFNPNGTERWSLKAYSSPETPGDTAGVQASRSATSKGALT
jgi:hypothetical protein